MTKKKKKNLELVAPVVPHKEDLSKLAHGEQQDELIFVNKKEDLDLVKDRAFYEGLQTISNDFYKTIADYSEKYGVKVGTVVHFEVVTE